MTLNHSKIFIPPNKKKNKLKALYLYILKDVLLTDFVQLDIIAIQTHILTSSICL